MKASEVKRLLITAGLAFALDMFTKWLVSQSMFQNESRSVAGEFLKITHVRNSGAAFGFFSGNRVILIVFSVLAMLFLLLLVTRSKRWTGVGVASLGLVLGGALGNLFDRVRSGRVIDFIDIGIGEWRWPVFNFADACVTVGVLVLAVTLYSGGANSPGEPFKEKGFARP